MPDNKHKIHTGFRISRENIKFIESTGQSLGLNKTAVVDMLITIMRKNPEALKKLIIESIK